MNFRTCWTLPIACLMTLTACQGRATVTRAVLLDVTKVVLPESVGAGAEMNVDVTVVEQCTETVPDVVAQRTASVLRLTVQRTTTEFVNPVTCPPVAFCVKRSYTDPGTSLRTNPFEVFVNGKSYGVIAIR